MTSMPRGIAVPNFATDPADLIRLGIAAEEAGFDGYFLWDHIVFSNNGEGPPIVDPWMVLAVVAANTSRITIGTVVTPVSRRRPWQLAKTTTTLDRLSGGRVVLGVGLGAPAYGDFGVFHEPSGDRERAVLLDEGLDVLAGLWGGEKFSFTGTQYTVDAVRFAPEPVQRPRIPVWVAGVLPASRPIARAARWDGFVPIRYGTGGMFRPSPADFADLSKQIAGLRGGIDGFDLVVWAEVARDPAAVPDLVRQYARAGATWWIETAWPEPGWWEGVRERIAAGP